MAEFETTQHYGLKLFGDDQTTLTFKEFRQIIAGANTADSVITEQSNMQKIDTILKQCERAIDNNLISAKNYSDEQMAAFKVVNDELIKANDAGNIVIGGENGAPIELRNGAQISYLQDGVFLVNGVEVDYVRIADYILKYNSSNKHFQISYKPKNVGGVI